MIVHWITSFQIGTDWERDSRSQGPCRCRVSKGSEAFCVVAASWVFEIACDFEMRKYYFYFFC